MGKMRTLVESKFHHPTLWNSLLQPLKLLGSPSILPLLSIQILFSLQFLHPFSVTMNVVVVYQWRKESQWAVYYARAYMEADAVHPNNSSNTITKVTPFEHVCARNWKKEIIAKISSSTWFGNSFISRLISGLLIYVEVLYFESFFLVCFNQEVYQYFRIYFVLVSTCLVESSSTLPINRDFCLQCERVL